MLVPFSRETKKNNYFSKAGHPNQNQNKTQTHTEKNASAIKVGALTLTHSEGGRRK